MKNITVTVSDETYRNARICAARRDASVSALVRDFLDTLLTSPYAGQDLPDGDQDTPSPPVFPVKL